MEINFAKGYKLERNARAKIIKARTDFDLPASTDLIAIRLDGLYVPVIVLRGRDTTFARAIAERGIVAMA